MTKARGGSLAPIPGGLGASVRATLCDHRARRSRLPQSPKRARGRLRCGHERGRSLRPSRFVQLRFCALPINPHGSGRAVGAARPLLPKGQTLLLPVALWALWAPSSSRQARHGVGLWSGSWLETDDEVSRSVQGSSVGLAGALAGAAAGAAAADEGPQKSRGVLRKHQGST